MFGENILTLPFEINTVLSSVNLNMNVASKGLVCWPEPWSGERLDTSNGSDIVKRRSDS